MPFTFWFSSEADADVDDALNPIRNEVEDALNEGLSGQTFGKDLTKWALIFILRAEHHPDYNEILRFHARRKVAEFRLKVDHAEFKRATPTIQIRLLLDVVLRSVREAVGVVPEGVDLGELEGAILKVASARGWSASRRGPKGRAS